jgi:hypothetical protein
MPSINDSHCQEMDRRKEKEKNSPFSLLLFTLETKMQREGKHR